MAIDLFSFQVQCVDNGYILSGSAGDRQTNVQSMDLGEHVFQDIEELADTIQGLIERNQG